MGDGGRHKQKQDSATVVLSKELDQPGRQAAAHGPAAAVARCRRGSFGQRPRARQAVLIYDWENTRQSEGGGLVLCDTNLHEPRWGGDHVPLPGDASLARG